MKHHLAFALFTLLAPGAFAQQTVKATFSSITIDGFTTPNSAVTINGKTYVAQDALKARGVAILKPASLGIYTYPLGSGPGIKLKGCMNEWLYNGVMRVRITNVQTETGSWRVSFDEQTTIIANTNAEAFQNHFDQGKILGLTSAGRIIDSAKNPLQVADFPYAVVSRGDSKSDDFTIRDADGTNNEGLTRVTLIPKANTAAKGVLTFDLTCKK